jgi:hypothetical protein
MATKAQIAANRRNAKKCTGPKTPEGKAASSMNALHHGLRARTVVLPGEKPEEFAHLHAGLHDYYQPQNPAERYLVDQAAIAQWMLVRAEVFAKRCYDDDPSAMACANTLAKMTLVTGRLERVYFKAYHELERIKAARVNQPKQPEKAEQSQQSGPPSAIGLYWVNPKTGERTAAARTPQAEALHDLAHPEMRSQQPVPPGSPAYRTAG